MSKELKWKKEVSNVWKKRPTTWKEYRNIARVYREAVRKTNSLLETNWQRM